jgi:hypothetical protein
MQKLDDQNILNEIKSKEPKKYIVMCANSKIVNTSSDPRVPQTYETCATIETIYFDNKEDLIDWAINNHNPETMTVYYLSPVHLEVEHNVVVKVDMNDTPS